MEGASKTATTTWVHSSAGVIEDSLRPVIEVLAQTLTNVQLEHTTVSRHVPTLLVPSPALATLAIL